MIVIPKLDIAFAGPPRTATSTVLQVFSDITGDDIDVTDPQKWDFYDMPGYKIVVTVRDPATRLWSLYKNYCINEQKVSLHKFLVRRRRLLWYYSLNQCDYFRKLHRVDVYLRVERLKHDLESLLGQVVNVPHLYDIRSLEPAPSRDYLAHFVAPDYVRLADMWLYS